MAIPTKAPQDLEVTNVRPSMVRTCGVEFMPGGRGKIPAAMVDAFRKGPLAGRVLLEGPVAMPAPAPTMRLATLANLEEAQAVHLVKAEGDLATLAAWAESEQASQKRKGVLDSISDRAAALAKTK